MNTNFRRNTQQRQVILDELRKLKSHPTAAGLYEIVRRKMPKISLGTVYRNLELLNHLGIIQKLEFGSSEARYDGNIVNHDHLRCVSCGRVDDAPDSPLVFEGGGNKDCGGYKVLGHRLEFFGYCPQCRRCQDD